MRLALAAAALTVLVAAAGHAQQRPPQMAALAAGGPGLSAKELQDIRDEVIGARAVVRHLMRTDGFRAGEKAYVEESVNRAGVVPAAVAGNVDEGKLKKWLTRAEAQA